MTKDKTVTMSRELAQKVDDLLYIMTGHDSYPRLIHKYGKEWWGPVNDMRAEICTILAAAVVERQEPVEIGTLHRDCDERIVFESSGEIHIKDGMSVFASPPAPVSVVLTMKDVMRANESVIGISMMTSNQCHALAKALTAVYFDKVKELNQ